MDSQRIGLFGTSFSGGHVFRVAAADHRLAAVAAVNPWVSGIEVIRTTGGIATLQAMRSLASSRWEAAADREADSTVLLGMRTADPRDDFALFRSDEAMDYYEHGPAGLPGTWRNELTMRSLTYLLGYDVSGGVEEIAPTPMLLVLSQDDVTMPGAPAQEIYRRLREPKDLQVVPGGHYDTYLPNRTMPVVVELVSAWFKQHL